MGNGKNGVNGEKVDWRFLRGLDELSVTGYDKDMHLRPSCSAKGKDVDGAFVTPNT